MVVPSTKYRDIFIIIMQLFYCFCGHPALLRNGIRSVSDHVACWTLGYMSGKWSYDRLVFVRKPSGDKCWLNETQHHQVAANIINWPATPLRQLVKIDSRLCEHFQERRVCVLEPLESKDLPCRTWPLMYHREIPLFLSISHPSIYTIVYTYIDVVIIQSFLFQVDNFFM